VVLHHFALHFCSRSETAKGKTKEVKFVSSSKGQGKDEIVVIQEGNEALLCYSSFFATVTDPIVPHYKESQCRFHEDSRQLRR
jgi:hypothetical protein